MRNVFPKTLFDMSMENYACKKQLFCSCENLTIVSCSDWMANFVEQSFLKDKRIEVIKNGVDLNVFKPLARKEIDGIFNILAVSNVWNKDKGLFDIYRLRNLLPEKYAITIVGLSAKQRDSLPTGINGIERTQNVNELVQLYSNADVLINPTYADTFPTVNLEALACGTPVVTYMTGGSPEAIDKQTGLGVEQGDVNGLVTAINDICSKDRTQLGKDCRARAEQYFDKDKCFERYIELYDELLSN